MWTVISLQNMPLPLSYRQLLRVWGLKWGTIREKGRPSGRPSALVTRFFNKD